MFIGQVGVQTDIDSGPRAEATTSVRLLQQALHQNSIQPSYLRLFEILFSIQTTKLIYSF